MNHRSSVVDFQHLPPASSQIEPVKAICTSTHHSLFKTRREVLTAQQKMSVQSVRHERKTVPASAPRIGKKVSLPSHPIPSCSLLWAADPLPLGARIPGELPTQANSQPSISHSSFVIRRTTLSHPSSESCVQEPRTSFSPGTEGMHADSGLVRVEGAQHAHFTKRGWKNGRGQKEASQYVDDLELHGRPPGISTKGSSRLVV